MPAHDELQHIPVLSPPSEYDLEALEHARRCVLARNDSNPHALDSRALSQLDRVIDQAQQVRR